MLAALLRRQKLALVCPRWRRLTWTSADFPSGTEICLSFDGISSLVQWAQRNKATLKYLHLDRGLTSQA